MPPKMHRQNAFFEEQEVFKDIACRICYESEVYGEWKRITCQCSIANDYYHAHEFCLQRLGKCKVCSTPFIIQQQKSPTTEKDKIYAYYQTVYDVVYKYRYIITVLTLVSICILITYDIALCTTIEKIDENDLPDLKSDSLWLPVFHVKCYKSRWSSYLTRAIFNIYFLITCCIFSISYYLYK